MKNKLWSNALLNIGKVIGIIFLSFLLFFAALCFFAAIWYVNIYGRIGFDAVLYTLTSSLNGVQSGLVGKFLTGAALPATAVTTVILLVLFLPWKKWGIHCKLFPFSKDISCLIVSVLSLVLLVHAAFNVELVDYIVNISQNTELYQEHYRNPEDVNITFPEKKRNLIYIMLESMETSYLDKAQGGAVDYNLIPELTQLAKDNINFSHNDQVGGFRMVNGASWTIGAMVGQTGGIPLKMPEGITDHNGYGKDGVFLPGLKNINTILDANGYNQALMVGSDANFGGRKPYYSTHGVEDIYDIYTARTDKIIPSNYFVWWGMEDLHLFDYAKRVIPQMAAQDEPFAFTMLTVDTHHIGGYTCSLCGNEYDESYENVISCSSRQVADFIRWLQLQPFYENTTIIVTGDHCSMDKGYFNRNTEEGYERHIYNCFINAAATPTITANREFSALDMFPTTLAAMGCKIEGERLGLGVNLFSNQPTLMERMGVLAFQNELAKASDYYTENFFQVKED